MCDHIKKLINDFFFFFKFSLRLEMLLWDSQGRQSSEKSQSFCSPDFLQNLWAYLLIWSLDVVSNLHTAILPFFT